MQFSAVFSVVQFLAYNVPMLFLNAETNGSPLKAVSAMLSMKFSDKIKTDTGSNAHTTDRLCHAANFAKCQCHTPSEYKLTD